MKKAKLSLNFSSETLFRMSQLVDADTLNVMIGETAGDLDNVVLPEDNPSVVGDMLEKHVKALGKMIKCCLSQ